MSPGRSRRYVGTCCHEVLSALSTRDSGLIMVAIRFTGNYEDLSTDRGYQFRFYCEKCLNGYMSTFKASAIGMIGSAARAAGSLFGGVFGNVADSSYEVQRAVGGGAHEDRKSVVEGKRVDLGGRRIL